jgi:hypothetical protein
LIAGFRRDVVEICALLGYYAPSFSILPIFMGQESGLLIREDLTDTLSQNVGKQLPHDAA